MTFEGLSREEARRFAERWLPAWTGGDAERLLAFYHPDAFYLDPAVPRGLRGRDALRRYFRRLLRRYPDWVWEQTDAVPLPRGFLSKWRARIPASGSGGSSVEFAGVCTVELEDGLIVRNEVYFDRGALAAPRGAGPARRTS